MWQGACSDFHQELNPGAWIERWESVTLSLSYYFKIVTEVNTWNWVLPNEFSGKYMLNILYKQIIYVTSKYFSVFRWKLWSVNFGFLQTVIRILIAPYNNILLPYVYKNFINLSADVWGGSLLFASYYSPFSGSFIHLSSTHFFFFFLVLGSKVLANNETKSLLSEIL